MHRLGAEAAVDTNVVVKFFVTETDSDKAVALRRACLGKRIALTAIDFLFIEFINTLWAKTRAGLLTPQEATACIDSLEDLAGYLNIAPSLNFLAPSFELACRHVHPAYDMALLAMAKSRGVPLITADAHFYRKISADYPAAVLLSDLQIPPAP